MNLPRIIKNANIFANGISWLGEVPSVTLPKLQRKMEDYRAGGMGAPVKLDHGMEGLELSFSSTSMLREAINGFGNPLVDGEQLRFAGAYQSDDGASEAVEVVVRGRYSELDFGDEKIGEKGERKHTFPVSYYKLTINGTVLVEIDIMNMVEIINGVDRLEQARRQIGV